MLASVDEVERVVVLDAPPGAVWRALTDGDELSQWFGADVTADVRPGGRAEFRFGDGSTRSAVIERVEAERRLEFRWVPFVREADGAAHPVPATRVEVALEPVGAGTRLLVRETPLATAEGRDRVDEASLAGSGVGT